MVSTDRFFFSFIFFFYYLKISNVNSDESMIDVSYYLPPKQSCSTLDLFV